MSRSRGESCADHGHEALADSGRADGTSSTSDGSSGRQREDGDVDDTGVEGRTGDSFSIRDIVDVDYDYDTRYCELATPRASLLLACLSHADLCIPVRCEPPLGIVPSC